MNCRSLTLVLAITIASSNCCIYNGKNIESESVQIDSTDQCKVLQCSEGILTRSVLQCRPGCREQIYKHNQCCPSCISEKESTKGCVLDGLEVKSGHAISKPGDKCTNCTCEHGEITCVQRACPVLNCPLKDQIQNDGCCPVCKEKVKPVSTFDGSCTFRGHPFHKGEKLMVDKCTNCMCKDGKVQCYRKSCHVPNCPTKYLVYNKENCCPTCKKSIGCPHEGKIHKVGDTWKKDSCTDCSCMDGKVSCQKITCGNVPNCSQKSILHRPPGECCPICVTAHSICSVTGSGKQHLTYSTFDGMNYDFSGTCRYTLLQDFAKRQVNIRLKNEYHPYPVVRTKLVTIITESTSIGIHRDFRIRVNKSKISIPFNTEKFSISSVKNSSVTVNLINGFKLRVDENGQVTVYVTPSWQSKLAGLCGNFNQVIKDDFKTKITSKIIEDADAFASTWRVGGKCACDKPNNSKRSSCTTADQRVRAHMKCDVLKSVAFKKCHQKIPVRSYVSACTDNVCECPHPLKGEPCECAIIQLYVKECAKHNIKIKLSKKSPCHKKLGKPEKKDKSQKKRKQSKRKRSKSLLLLL